MAKRNSELVVRRGSGSWVDVWCDDALVPLIETIKGILRFQHMTSGEWTAWLDPRYDINEVVAEIEALGENESSPKPVYIEKQARVLASAACQHGVKWVALKAYLQAVETDYTGGGCGKSVLFEQFLWDVLAEIEERLRCGHWR